MATFTLSDEDATAIRAAIGVASAHFGWSDRVVTDADVEAFVHHALAGALDTDLQTIYEAASPSCAPEGQRSGRFASAAAAATATGFPAVMRCSKLR